MESELYELRLLVFIETEPQSNKYNQVLLTMDQFKKVGDAIGKITESNDLRDGFEQREVSSSKEEYKLPDLRSINF